MYTPTERTIQCYYCGRTNHMTSNCRYKELDLQRITRDPHTKKLKKHFNRKTKYPKEEKRPLKASSSSPVFTNTSKQESKDKGFERKPPKPSPNLREQNFQPLTRNKTPSKESSPAPKHTSSNPENYLKCKDCITWQMRLHNQANYWKDEYKRFDNTQNIIDSLTKENMNLRKERDHWKDLYFLLDRDNLSRSQIARRSKSKN